MTSQLNRRSFLTRTALAGGLTLLAPHARAEGSNSDLRVAIIGLNHQGRNLLDEILRTDRVRLVAVCDVDPSILRQQVASLQKKGVKVAGFADYRKLCETKDIDAVVVATPNHTHVLISVTAAAAGKHVYVETPVSHNVWEGLQLTAAQEAFGVVIQHGFQRRTEKAWHDAFEWIAKGSIGELKVARAICYQPRPSIGKVRGAQIAPERLDYDLWCGPRTRIPILRERFHQDWRWQSPWGNGELGDQGAHLLDVCRWALGDPESMPRSVASCGNRFGHDDDGFWPNTLVASFDYEKAPILIEVRGLPSKGMDYAKGMDSYCGVSVGNVIDYEKGSLIGGPEAKCRVVDQDGKELASFGSDSSPIQAWAESIQSGIQKPMLSADCGQHSSALAHLANISWMLGPPSATTDEGDDAFMIEATSRMTSHLASNDIDLSQTALRIGPRLTPLATGEAFTGENKEVAGSLLKGDYREGFRLPI